MKIGIAAKLTKIEWDMLQTGLNRDALLKSYEKKHLDIGKIIASHERQKACIDDIYKMLWDAEHIDILDRPSKNISMLFAIGGDNFFQRCAFYYPDSILVGVNSDPETSAGALLNFNLAYLRSNIEDIIFGEYDVLGWTKVKTTINKKPLEDALCTVSVKSADDDQICRYLLHYDCLEKNIEEEQKSSGILVVSGSGSGKKSWYRNAGLYLPQVKSGLCPETTTEFPKNAARIMSLTREPFEGEDCKCELLNPEIKKGAGLKLTYLATNSDGIVSIDSIKKYPIKEGDIVEFSVSEKKLNVLYARQPYH